MTAIELFREYKKKYEFGFALWKAAHDSGISISDLSSELGKHKKSKIKYEKSS